MEFQSVENFDYLSQRASILVEALPYIRRFAGKVIVIKYGGNVLQAKESSDDESSLSLLRFAQDVVLMRSVGMKPVIVHGGGPQIDEWLHRIGKLPTFKDGLRVTDSETLEVVSMVLLGKVNPEIVSALNRHGELAVGISGVDAQMVLARGGAPDMGYVGEVENVNPEILRGLLAEGLIPVVASIGADRQGQSYNINADHVASAVAAALEAEKLVYLSNVEGIRRDPADPKSLIRQIDAQGIEKLLANAVISGGMIPKVKSALAAMRDGVRNVHFLDGRVPHALLLEVFTDEGIGTMIVDSVEEA